MSWKSAQRYPFLSLFGLVVLSNAAGSFFNAAYPLCLGLLVWLLAPLWCCRQRLVNLPFHTVWLNFCGWFPGPSSSQR